MVVGVTRVAASTRMAGQLITDAVGRALAHMLSPEIVPQVVKNLHISDFLAGLPRALLEDDLGGVLTRRADSENEPCVSWRSLAQFRKQREKLQPHRDGPKFPPFFEQGDGVPGKIDSLPG
ncbi:MAG: hypothetical protein JWL59_310 [Chthoniobacteraceae bacterium]|nr:hypothetical protein [Chthoniobacteraceae bacterium]